MISFEEALTRILEDVRVLASERVELWNAAGRVLEDALVADTALPRFDYSAMDGYAVNANDLVGEGPWTLPVDGEITAGALPLPLKPGSASRIFTGAMIPKGADAVVMQEHVARSHDKILIAKPPLAGSHIRRAGEDMRAGQVALAQGTRLGPGAIALAAMLDRQKVGVSRRPRVSILSTGNELRPLGSNPKDGTIPESVGPALAAMIGQACGLVTLAPPVRDDPEATEMALSAALREADLLLTVGGVSVGDHDCVRPALERVGVALDFWKVAIRPGKPLAFGRSPSTYVLGLPGNPASALVTFALFGMPLLRAMQGDARPKPIRLVGRLERRCVASLDRMTFVRATLSIEQGKLIIHPHENQASGAATSLATSDGLAIIPPGTNTGEEGTFVEMIRWMDL